MYTLNNYEGRQQGRMKTYNPVTAEVVAALKEIVGEKQVWTDPDVNGPKTVPHAGSRRGTCQHGRGFRYYEAGKQI